jgi:hypothetical protein
MAVECARFGGDPPRDKSHGFGFVVRHHNDQLRRIPLEDIGAAELATVEAIRTLGGDEAMVETLAQLSDDERPGAFVALFADGTLLLASTDPAGGYVRARTFGVDATTIGRLRPTFRRRRHR